jgi:AbrB family looped-hinge helix DNA binding protein
MVETRYYKDKIYIPRDIRERLKLRDGDIIHFEVTEDGDVRLIVHSVQEATERILKRLQSPPDLGKIVGTLRRAELYEDIA